MNRAERRAAIGFGRPWWSHKHLARNKDHVLMPLVSPFGHQVREAGRELRMERYGHGVRYGKPAVPASRAGKGIVGYKRHD